jgi:cardiolipin synthase A/B
MKKFPLPSPWRIAWLLLACVASVAACRSLPTVSPDLAPAPTRPRIEGAQGPLSPHRAHAILEALKQRAPSTGIFDRHLALEEALAGRPLVAGNKVTLLQDGDATYKDMFEAIRTASDHIHLETYIFDGDDLGRRFAKALIAKRREGVGVAVVYDSVGALSTPEDFFRPLRDAGVQLLEFNPVNPLIAKTGWNLNERDHRKLLVVDGRVAFLGGINISGVYSRGSSGSASRGAEGLPWRDTHLRIEGPVVADFQDLFLKTWTQQQGPALLAHNPFPELGPRGKEVVRAIDGTPQEPYSAIYATLISAIDSAETDILMTNAYFAPDPQLRAALKAAVRRGVSVQLILPSVTDSSLIFHAGRSYYSELLRAGIRIFERRDVLLHCKTVVIDGVWSTVGSTNLDWRSFLHNHELNAVVLGADFGAQMRTAFERDRAASAEITISQWTQRSLGDRVKQGLARLWEYWL